MEEEGVDANAAKAAALVRDKLLFPIVTMATGKT